MAAAGHPAHHPSNPNFTPVLGNPTCRCGNRYGVRWHDDQLLCRLCVIGEVLKDVG